MKSNLVVDMVRAHYSHSEEEFRRIVNTIIDDEYQKGNRSLSVSLQRSMSARGPIGNSRTITSKMASPTLTDSLIPSIPSVTLDDVSLPGTVRHQIETIIEGYERSEDLRTAGLEPVGRILLYGPPGCGKTMVAHAIADALGKKIMVADFGNLVSSLMGQTGSNIGGLFESAISHDSVLFIDEIDAVGCTRSTSHDLGEMRRVVVSLMQNLDSLPQGAVVIAATNMFDDLDPAVIRRFQRRIEIEKPDSDGRMSIIRKHLSKTLRGYECELRDIETLTEGMTGSELTDFLDDVSRRALLENYEGIVDAKYALETVLGRFPDDRSERLKYYRRLNTFKIRGVSVADLSRISGIKYNTLNDNLKRM